MVVLKKFRASTLMETLVATVLIVVIFMLASLLLNSIYASGIRGNTRPLTAQFQKLEYAHRTGMISIPHTETWEAWNIEMFKENIGANEYIIFEATEIETKRKLKHYAILQK